MENQKSQSGITLIALVISIIVLLILSGITVTYLVSDDGIFSSVNQAKDANSAGTISDHIMTAQAGLETAFYNPYLTEAERTYKTKIQDFMKEYFPESTYTLDCTRLTVDSTSPKFVGSMTIEVGGKTYNVNFDANGKATIMMAE